MIKSGIFNSVNGDRKYSAVEFASYFASFIGDGVFPNPSSGLQVVAGENMAVAVKAGKGWIKGYYLTNDSDHILQLDIGDGLLKRIDRVVMRLNHLTRQIEIVVKKGTFASSPVAPPIQRDTDAWELVLADVFVVNGATQITQANITDQRLNSALCGIVHGTVNQVDTTTFFNQYQSWMTQRKTEYETDFLTWSNLKESEVQQFIDDLNAMLDGDVAANLANNIAQVDSRLTTHLAQDAKHAPDVIGTAGQLLAVNNTEDGTEWKTVSLSDGAWVKIAEKTLTSAVAAIIFSAVPSEYKNLRIIYDAISVSGQTDMTIRFNEDVNANYRHQTISSIGATINTSGVISDTRLVLANAISPTGAGFSFGTIELSNFNPFKEKRMMADYYQESNATPTSSTMRRNICGGAWSNKTDEINNITIYAYGNQFDIGSRFTLWGCK